MSNDDALKATWDEYAPKKDPRYILEIRINNTRVYTVPLGLSVSSVDDLPKNCLVGDFKSIDKAVDVADKLNRHKEDVRAQFSPRPTTAKVQPLVRCSGRTL